MDETEVVRLAIMAAGVVDDPKKWQSRVVALTPQIAAMMRPPMPGKENDATTPVVTARKMMNASVFTAEYVDHELEETSKRLVARFRSETANAKETEGDGTEHLRTEPMWTPAGRSTRRILESLSPGDRVIVYKHIDAIEGGQKKSRVLVHLERVGGSRRSAAPPAPPSGESAASQPSGVDRPAPDGTVDERRAELLESRYEKLSPPQRVALAKLCRADGITAFMMPSDDEFDRVLVHMSHVEKGSPP